MHVKKFRHYLLGRSFVIRTDHAALQWLRRTPEPIGQQARWLEILEEFDFQIQHRPGRQHCNADSLSRSVSTVTTDRTDWATLQRSDPVIGPIYRLVQAGEPRPTPESVAASDSEMKSLCTPYFLMYGREAGIPADLVYGPPPQEDQERPIPEFVEEQRETFRQAYEATRCHLSTAAQRRKRNYDLRSRRHDFPIGPWLWVLVPRRRQGRYHKWQSLYQGPFLVTHQLGPVNYRVQRSPRANPWVVHVDKLKTCHDPGTESWLEGPADPTPTPEPSPSPETPSDAIGQSERPRRHVRPPARFRD